MHFQHSLERSESLGYAPYIAHALANLGRIEAAEGRHDAALRHHQEALQVSRELGNRLSTVRSLSHCASALQHLGETAREAVDAMASLTKSYAPTSTGDLVDRLRVCLEALPVELSS